METSFDEAIDLKLWYLQLAHGLKTVRVAGFRAIDENNLQRYLSSPIIRRESAVCVLSKHHTYRLLGSIDEQAAELNGFPRELISFFRNGFPPNWEQLMTEYFEETSFDKSQWAPEASDLTQRTMIGSNRMRSSCPQRYSTFVDNVPLGTRSAPRSILRNSLMPPMIDRNEEMPKSGARRKSVQIVAPIDEETFEKQREESRTESIAKAKVPTSAEKNSRTSTGNSSMNSRSAIDPALEPIIAQAKNKPLVRLTFWMFAFLPTKSPRAPAVLIRGYTFDDDVNDWIKTTTTEVVHVEDRNIVYTRSGSRYLLEVMDNVENYAIPEWVGEKFAGGFPDDWRQTLEKVFKEFVSSVEIEEKFQDEKDEIKKKRRSLRLSFSPDNCRKDSKSKDSPKVSLPQVIKDPRVQKRKSLQVKTAKESDSSTDEEELMLEARKIERKMRKEKKRNKMIKKRLSAVPEHDPNDSTKTSNDDTVFKRPFDLDPLKKRQTISPQVAYKAIIPGVTRTEELKTTRSGRLVHMPLAQWAGERKVHDKDGNLIGMEGIMTQTQLTVGRKSSADTASISQYYGYSASPMRTTKQAQRFLQRPEEEPRVIRKKTMKSRDEEDSIYTNEEDSCIERLKAEFGSTDSVTNTPGGPYRKRSFRTMINSDESEESDYEQEMETQRKRQNIDKRKTKEKPKKATSSKQASRIKLKTASRVKEERRKSEVESSKVKAKEDSKVEKKKNEEVAPDPNDPIFIAKQREQRMKKVTKMELHRFKVGLKLRNPRTDKQWETLASMLTPELDIEAWKELADTRLGWKPKVADERTNDTSIASTTITARQGTIAYQVQADKFTRNYVRTGGNDDYFEANKENTSQDEETTNMFDADDSIIELLATPNPPTKSKNGKGTGKGDKRVSQGVLKKRNASRRQGNDLMDLLEREEEMGMTGGPRASFTPVVDSAKRENNQRYISHLRNQSTINSSSSFFCGKY